MRAEIVSTGTELVLGEITDTNMTHIARALREIGVELLYCSTVGDDERRIAEVIDIALDRVDVVIVNGGLGPTVDDVTREGIAHATHRPLVVQSELLEVIAERFKQLGVRMTENNRRQAFVPEGAQAIQNPVGTAPIFILETERGVVITLPGVPSEMAYLLEREVIPWLQAHLEAPTTIRSRALRTAGVGESRIDALIGDLMHGINPMVRLAAHSGQTDIRITARAATEAEAEALIGQVEAKLRERVGKWIYGMDDETLEEVIAEMLAAQTATLAIWEAGTNGLLSERLKRAGAAFLIGEAAAEEGSAEEAAEALRQARQTTFGLLVRIDPEKGTIIGVAGPQSARSRHYPWTASERADAPIWATTLGLAMLRRAING